MSQHHERLFQCPGCHAILRHPTTLSMSAPVSGDNVSVLPMDGSRTHSQHNPSDAPSVGDPDLMMNGHIMELEEIQPHVLETYYKLHHFEEGWNHPGMEVYDNM